MGLANAFQHANHQIFWWNPKLKCEFDIFSEVNPDLYMAESYNLTRAEIKCVEQRPNMKVILKSFNWGEIDSKIDRRIYPIGISDAKEQETICDMRRRCGKPDFLYNYYHANKMKATMGFWEENGVPILSLQQAADIYTYQPTKPDPRMISDVVMIGGAWGFKSREMDAYMRRITFPVGKFNVKIFGNSRWSYPQYISPITIEDEVSAYSSATICPNFFEPHHIFGFELNERLFKLGACKAFQLCQRTGGLDDVFTNEEVVTFESPEEFEHLCRKYIKNPELRQPHIDAAYNTVMSTHTYDHRVKYILEKIGENA